MRKLYALGMLLLSTAGTFAQQVPNTLTPEQKLFGLSSLWSEAKYNEVSFENIGVEKWDSAYRALIKPVMESPDDYAYCRLLQRYCALLRDGHSSVWPRFMPVITTYFDKLQWYLSRIEGKAIVTDISSKQKDLVPIGSEIVEVNGIPVQAYIEKEVWPYISASTDHARMDDAVSLMFQSLKGTSYRVKLVTPAGKTLEMDLTHEIRPEIQQDELYPSGKWERLKMKWYPGQIAYVQLNSFNDRRILDEFAAIVPELKKAKKLIVDLRQNGGGNTSIGRAILTYLVPGPEMIGSKWRTRVHNPAYMSWGVSYTPQDTVGDKFATRAYQVANRQYYEESEPQRIAVPQNQEHIVVPTVLLIGHQTASSTEDFLVLTDRQKHMTKIGQKTNGSTGNPVFYRLDGDIHMQICSKRDTYPDGREFVGCGIEPDIEVVPTVQDVVRNYDRALEKALAFLKKSR